MTALLPELAQALPPDVQLDGELVAWATSAAPTGTVWARASQDKGWL